MSTCSSPCWSIPNRREHLALVLGNGLHPVQWLTANFVHGSLSHLAGNMFALWTFGLIVEGKLGWWKTLLLFLGLGCAEYGIVQYVMLGSPARHCLGASGIIFAFMAMSLIWCRPTRFIAFGWSWSLFSFASAPWS